MTGPDCDPTPEAKAAWAEHLRTEPRLAHYARFLVYLPFVLVFLVLVFLVLVRLS
jgi:hypothetical protein